MSLPETAVYFTTVAIQSPGRAIIAGHLFAEASDPTVTRVYICDAGDWSFAYDVNDVVYATATIPTGQERRAVALLGRHGLFRENAPGKKPKDTAIRAYDDSYWMDLRLIGSSLYACGIQNQVIRRSGNTWVAVDQGIAEPLDDEVTATLQSIDGFGENDIYAVGDGGVIWHWNGKKWQSLESPTNLPLYAVKCASDGRVYVGGSGGTLLMGHAQTAWADLSDPAVCDDVFESIVEFKGQVYLTATDKLISAQGTSLIEVSPKVRGTKVFYAGDASDESMWMVGDQSVLRFDGKKWHRYECPDNV